MRQQSSQKQRSTGAFLPILILIASLALSAAAAPPEGKLYSRTLSIGGSARQPKFSLDISAAGRIGKVVVNNPAGAKIQTLTCDLFRDWGPKIAGHTGDPRFWREVGYLLRLAIRPESGQVHPKFAEPSNGGLGEPHVDEERHQIVAFTIGPTYPNRDEYRIDRSSAIHAQRRLLAVRSCELDTAQTEGAARPVSVVTYAASREVVQRRTVSADCNDACGAGCPTYPRKELDALEDSRPFLTFSR